MGILSLQDRVTVSESSKRLIDLFEESWEDVLKTHSFGEHLPCVRSIKKREWCLGMMLCLVSIILLLIVLKNDNQSLMICGKEKEQWKKGCCKGLMLIMR